MSEPRAKRASMSRLHVGPAKVSRLCMLVCTENLVGAARPQNESVQATFLVINGHFASFPVLPFLVFWNSFFIFPCEEFLVFFVFRAFFPSFPGIPWKLKPGFINRVLVAVIFEASKCL